MIGNKWVSTAIAGVAAASAVFLVGYVGIWQWMICRVEVPPGYSLLLRYKGPWPFGSTGKAPDGTLVQIDRHGRPLQVGILEAMPGPGRHFYSPLEFDRELVKDQVIAPGKLAVVTSKVGKALPPGTYLTDQDGYRGIRRQVLTPGRYRLNSYAYDVRVIDVDACVEPSTRPKRRDDRAGHPDPTLIPPGYVGVVTYRTDNPLTGAKQGIQSDVLQPGVYFFNPEEKRIDIVSIGYNETTLVVETEGGPSGEPFRGDRLGKANGADPKYLQGKGVEFKSNDGFPIHLDFTAIWGIVPDQAPGVVRQFGRLKDVDQKVIIPQIGSICGMHGSRQGAVDLLVGETREAFQDETSDELASVLKAKNLTLLFGLTRHIYVPRQVREPIQKAKIAVELTKTREQEQLTAKAQAELTEAKAKVTLAERTTKATTEKLVAQAEAEGEKAAKEIEAETEKLKAEIDAKTAVIEAESTRLLGEANAKKVELSRQAEADRFRQYVSALGGAEAYNQYVFAEGLSPDIKLGVFYAGPGTFWTDLKGFEQTMLGRLASETPPRPANAAAGSTSTLAVPTTGKGSR